MQKAVFSRRGSYAKLLAVPLGGVNIQFLHCTYEAVCINTDVILKVICIQIACEVDLALAVDDSIRAWFRSRAATYESHSMVQVAPRLALGLPRQGCPSVSIM